MVFVELPNKAVRLVVRFLEKMGLKMAVNAFFTVKQIGRQVLHAAINKLSVEGGSQILERVLPSNEVASADTILRYLHSLSPEKAQKELQANIRQARDFAKTHYLQPVIIAIDFHEEEYYGDHNNPHVVGTKPKNGTSWAFRYITADIVENGKRLCIDCQPFYSDNEKATALASVLERAKRFVKIALVLIDRGFYTVECIKTLKKAGLFFIMPVIKDKKMVRLMKENANLLPWVGTYTLGGKTGETFTLGLKREDDEIYGFATNIIFEGSGPEEMKTFVEKIAETYSSRWGIETGYRVKGNFLAKTTTRDHKIRSLYFFLSVILYNAWILTNQLLEKNVTIFLFCHLLEKELVIQNLRPVTTNPP